MAAHIVFMGTQGERPTVREALSFDDAVAEVADIHRLDVTAGTSIVSKEDR